MAAPAPLAAFSAIDVYESATAFVLVGHDGERRRLLHVQRRPPGGEDAAEQQPLPPVSEEPRMFSVKACERRLAELSEGQPLEHRLRASALLGMVRFLEGWYMLFVTRAEVRAAACLLAER